MLSHPRALRSRAGLTAAVAGAAACAAAPARDGPVERPAWLARITAEPIRGRPIGEDEWRISGGDADGGPRTPAGFPSRGVTLLAWLPLNALPGDSEAGADCWGYTSPSGREYAIMCVHNGTSLIEVTDPLNPRVVGFVGGASSLWHDPTPWKPGPRPSRLGASFSSDATVVGGYCYAVSDVEGGSGIQIIDLRRIDQGIVTHVRNWSAGGLRSVRTISADEQGRRLWACGSNVGNGGLVCIDISNPESPSLAGAWTAQPMEDCIAFTPVRGPLAGRSIVAGFAGPAGGAAAGVVLVSAADPANISELARIAYPEPAACRQGWITPDLRHLYTGDAPSADARDGPATRVIQVADPSSPVYLGRLPGRSATSIVRNQLVAGRTLYQARGTSGLRVLDATDPLRPVEFAFFDTCPENDDPKDRGAWGVYPFFRSGTILVSDMQRGLFVVRVHARTDLDRDGRTSFLDFVTLDGLRQAADPRADLDGDGVLNACDLEEFWDLAAAETGGSGANDESNSRNSP